MENAPSTGIVAFAMQTPGEAVFGNCLTKRGIPFEFERVHAGKAKRPDFTITWEGEDCLFDLKDRTRPPDGLVIDDPLADARDEDDLNIGSVEPPYRWIREQIEQGRRKFKEFKGSPCAIVMFPADGWGHDLCEPDFVLGAMYGDFGIVVPRNSATGMFDGDKFHGAFLDNGKMIRPRWKKPQNTSLSALITLRTVNVGQARLNRYLDENYPNVRLWQRPDILSKVDFDISEKHIGVIVWENVFAIVPFPSDLFRGPYDERWGRDGEVIRRVHVGSALADCLARGV